MENKGWFDPQFCWLIIFRPLGDSKADAYGLPLLFPVTLRSDLQRIINPREIDAETRPVKRRPSTTPPLLSHRNVPCHQV